MTNAHHRRLWINLALALVVLILLSIVWWVERKQDYEYAMPPILSLDAENLKHIEIIPSAAEGITLKRDEEGQWWLTNPIVHPAGSARIHQFKRLMALSPSASYPVDNTIQLQSYGLLDPEYTLRFNGATLTLGNVNPVSRQRYARLDDGDVMLIPDYLTRDLPHEFAAYVSPRLLPDDAEIIKVELPQATLVYNHGSWEVESDQIIDETQIRLLIDTWEDMVAASAHLLQNQIADYELTLHLDDGQRIRFQVLETEPVLRLSRPDLGLVYVLPAGWGHDLILR